MIDITSDQAAGLRALLNRALPEVLSVVPCGAAAMRWVARQALQRAAIGQRVLAFDERQVSGNLADCLGVAPRFDLLQAVEGHVELGYCLADVPGLANEAHVSGSLSVLSVASLAREIDADRILRQRTVACLSRLHAMSDEWLLLAEPSDVVGLSAFARAAPRLLLVVDPVERAITEAYAALKRLVRTANVLAVGVCVAGAEQARARLMVTRLRQVAAAQLGIEVQAVSSVGEALGMAIPEAAEHAFAERLLGQAASAPRRDAGSARAFV